MAIMENKRLYPLVTLVLFYFFSCSFRSVQSLSSNVDVFDISGENLESNSHINFARSKRSADHDVTDIEGDNEQVCKLQLMEFKEARDSLKNGERLEETVNTYYNSKIDIRPAFN